MKALLLLAALACAGWKRQPASLLFFDEQDNIVSELPLRTEEELSGSKISVRQIRGDAAAGGRFAWTLDRTIVHNQSRTKELSSKRLLRVFGSGGKEIWADADADVPESGAPVLFSADGEVVMISQRTAKGWTASVRTYMGSVIFDIGPLARLQSMALTANGKYAMARWMVPDKSATHTFLEVATKTRHDIPSGDLRLGTATITEDGKVISAKKVVFDFAAQKKAAP